MIRKEETKRKQILSGGSYRATGVVSLGTMTSRILGVVREQVIAYLFGASAVTDAFVAAFRIPNLLRDLLAEGALSAAFVPTFTEQLKQRGLDAARQLYEHMQWWILIGVGAICLLGIIFTPQIATLLAAGFDETPGKLTLTIELARIMFPFLLFVSLAALSMGALNAHARFGPPAFAPLWFNVAIILCAVAAALVMEQPIYGLAIGVAVGGLGQWAFQQVFLLKLGYPRTPRLGLSPEIRRVFRLMLPAVIGLAAVQINIFVVTRVASELGNGPVSYLNFAFRLIFVPLGVFAVAAATVGLPRISERVADGDTPGAIRRWLEGLRLVWFLTIPAMAAFLFFGEDICRLLYQRGAFSAADTQFTAAALFFYALGLPGMATIRTTAPVFYAHKDTTTPVIFSFASVVTNLGLIALLVDRLNFRGLALAIAGAATVQALGLLLTVRLRYGDAFLGRLAMYFIGLAVLGVGVTYGVRLLVPPGTSWADALLGIAGIFVAGALYLLITWLLRVSEVNLIWGAIRRKTRR